MRWARQRWRAERGKQVVQGRNRPLVALDDKFGGFADSLLDLVDILVILRMFVAGLLAAHDPVELRDGRVEVVFDSSLCLFDLDPELLQRPP